MASTRSRVHPKYKTRYRVRNWATYVGALATRGDITPRLSPEAVAGWESKPSGRRGGQEKFSDLAIVTCLTLLTILRLPLRQTEGFVRSLLRLGGLDMEAPDHSTLSRRGSAHEPVLLRPKKAGPVRVIEDRTGLSVSGQGQGASATHRDSGGRGGHIGPPRPEGRLVFPCGLPAISARLSFCTARGSPAIAETAETRVDSARSRF